eukprot:GHVU01125830.1.p1 GENE.GHVU01125830.1~~GHVU01125830.1.p1  ORF type:complete len:164 (+),score=12.71 GHVU01125830.1:23-493(+)
MSERTLLKIKDREKKLLVALKRELSEVLNSRKDTLVAEVEELFKDSDDKLRVSLGQFAKSLFKSPSSPQLMPFFVDYVYSRGFDRLLGWAKDVAYEKGHGRLTNVRKGPIPPRYWIKQLSKEDCYLILRSIEFSAHATEMGMTPARGGASGFVRMM